MVIRGRKASPYSVNLGPASYTIIENNRNGTVWVGGIPENDKYKIVKPDNYRAGYGVSINPKDLVKKIQENAKTGKAARVMAWKVGVSVQVGSVLGTNEADKIDNAIRGRSFGLQACHFACIGVSKGEGKEGAVIISTGIGNTQIGVNGSVMRPLTDKEKETLRELRILR